MSAHPCIYDEDIKCSGAECDDIDRSFCDKDGCDLNSYRGGNQTFYGPGPDFMIDTTSPMKIVTQFHTKNNTSYDDPVVEMTRIFV